MLLEARDITKTFGSFKAVDAASVTLEQGDILGLIGPNGAGKSTFFNCLTGDLSSKRGQVNATHALQGGVMSVSGQVPLSELTGYQARLNGMTGGQGRYTLDRIRVIHAWRDGVGHAHSGCGRRLP